MTDIEHISRKGTGVPISWFPIPEESELPDELQGLFRKAREMIAVAVSMANGCLYCLVAHGAALRQALGDPILADRITLDHRRAGLDERRTAILDFAVKVTERPLDCDPGDLERLRGYGLTEEEVWDVVEIASMYNFTNRMSLACGMIPNEEYHALAR
jgi:uncharacterized peroxidase-related enzyme